MCLFLALLIPGFGGTAHALDITLHVPVELVNLPASIAEGYVHCRIHPANTTTGTMYAASLLGEGNTRFNISGNFIAMADIAIRNNIAPPPAVGWNLALYLRDTAAGRDNSFGLAGTVLNGYWVDTAKPVKYTTTGIR